jgi:hypothetical protein
MVDSLYVRILFSIFPFVLAVAGTGRTSVREWKAPGFNGNDRMSFYILLLIDDRSKQLLKRRV